MLTSSLRLLSQGLAPLSARALSSSPPQMPPPELTYERATGIIDTTLFYVNHGLSNKHLSSIKDIPFPEDASTASKLVGKWQKMMEAHFSTQVTVLTALGYPQSEQGLQIYNGQLQQLMSSAAPGEQEKLRVGSRDLWRTTLGHTFGMPRPNDPEANPGNKVMGVKEELGVVEARDVM